MDDTEDAMTMLIRQFISGEKIRIDDYKRAVIIDEYLKQKQISQREFGRIFSVPHSTIQDWLQILKMPEHDFKILVERHGKTEVYHMLRNNRMNDIKRLMKIDRDLDWMIERLNRCKICSEYTKEKIKLLKSATDNFIKNNKLN